MMKCKIFFCFLLIFLSNLYPDSEAFYLFMEKKKIPLRETISIEKDFNFFSKLKEIHLIYKKHFSKELSKRDFIHSYNNLYLQESMDCDKEIQPYISFLKEILKSDLDQKIFFQCKSKSNLNITNLKARVKNFFFKNLKKRNFITDSQNISSFKSIIEKLLLLSNLEENSVFFNNTLEDGLYYNFYQKYNLILEKKNPKEKLLYWKELENYINQEIQKIFYQFYFNKVFLLYKEESFLNQTLLEKFSFCSQIIQNNPFIKESNKKEILEIINVLTEWNLSEKENMGSLFYISHFFWDYCWDFYKLQLLDSSFEYQNFLSSIFKLWFQDSFLEERIFIIKELLRNTK